ncbi:MAG: hypothetical protein HN368_23255 [Spirochaetales bacterium]|nr:hypothetical protein [Spirochaetales bacterium]
MTPIFTIHAGEYLVGSFIEKTFKNLNVWIPSKDTGIDLLVTNTSNKRTASYQVKFSKDFTPDLSDAIQSGLSVCGWWTLSTKKIAESTADYWVFINRSLNRKKQHFVVIKPSTLLKRLTDLYGTAKTLQHYFWIDNQNNCWATRGLKKQELLLIAKGAYSNPARDFTKHLDNWSVLERMSVQKQRKGDS